MMFRRGLLVLLMAVFATVSVSGQSPKANSSNADTSVKPFLGRWDLTLKTPQREYPSWLEIEQEGGKLKATIVSRWGNARPVSRIELSGGRLIFVSPKEEEERKDDMVFQGKLVSDVLVGNTTGQDGTPWQWTGRRAPTLKRNGTPKWGKPVSLFNGKDLSGWRMDNQDSKPPWKVIDGTLVSPGHGPEIVAQPEFNDFKLHIEFNCEPNSNSGIYLRGRYEVQVEDDSIKEPPSHHMGGIYGFLAPSPEMPRKPGVWQTFDITLVGRVVTVVQNGTTIIDEKEIPGITGGALDSHEELPGPIYLQGSENGHVAYRNIVITPAGDK